MLLTRRRLLLVFASAALGLRQLNAAPPAGERRNALDPLFIVHLSGGAAAKDTFNPDPPTTPDGNAIPASTRGPFGTIGTRIAGVRYTSPFQELADCNNRYALIRSLDSGSGDHTPSQMTSVLSDGITMSERIGDRAANGGVPYVLLNPGSSWGGLRDAFRINHAFAPLWNQRESRYTPPQLSRDTSQLDERVELLRGFEETAPAIVSASADRHERFRESAIDLLQGGGAFLEAFDLPQKDRERYGPSQTGDAILLGKRLLERGAGSVTYYDEPESIAWDTHSDTERRITGLGRPMSKAIATLIEEIHAGLTRCTVLVTTEFNREPDMRDGGGTGRGHWPQGNWAILAGSRIREGVVVGRTNHRGVICDGRIEQRETLSNTMMIACGMTVAATRPRIREVLL